MEKNVIYKLNFETAVRDIDRWGTLTGRNDIHFEPRKSDDYNPVEVISIIQFLISNTGSNSENSIIINLDVEDLRALPKEQHNYIHLLSLLLYDRNGRFKLKSGKHLLTTDLIDQFIEGIHEQEELYVSEFEDEATNGGQSNILKRLFFPARDTAGRKEGISIFIPCFDHLRREGLHRTEYFYTDNSFKDDEDIAIWIGRLLRYNNLKFEVSSSIEDLAIMVKELMQNTHDWARSTYDDSAFILPNLRACYLTLILNHASRVENLSSYDPVQHYLKTVLNSSQNSLLPGGTQGRIFEDAAVGVCEISVIDGGPGMASRILEKGLDKISFEDEATAVIRCFHKYITSETGGRKQLRGKGLSKVIKLIRTKGFIRVRTGRVLLMRDFLENPLTQTEIDNGDLSFSIDTGLPNIKGTSISVLYPFVYLAK